MNYRFFLILIFLSVSSSTFGGSEIKIEKLDESKLSEIIHNREGKILLLNIWASWCLPCKEEMPALNKIHNKYEEYVDVIGLSIDYPDEIESKIIPFIKSNSIDFKIYVSNFKKDVDLINFFDVDLSGAIPVTFVYDRKGNLKFFFEGKRDYPFFEQEILKVLND